MNLKYAIPLIGLLAIVLLVGLKISIADTATGQAGINNAAPTVTSVALYDEAGNSSDAIDLTSGSKISIDCNATLTDNNGYENISAANATLYDSTSTSEAADDENIHYSNTSCTIGTNTSTTQAPVSCSFNIDYMAINGTWTCNITADDGVTLGSGTDANTLNALAALDVLNATISFGSMNLDSNSTAASAMDIQNLGNTQIDAQFSGNAYSCTDAGTIPVGNTRYNLTSGSYDGGGTDLTTSAVTQTGFNLGARGVATADGTNSTKLEYWTILIPSTGVAGTCTNTLTVAATAG